MAKQGDRKSGLKLVPGGTPAEGSDTAKPARPGLLRKGDLLDRLAAGSGLKKPQVKDTLEVVLAELGAALERGDDLVLPPLGRLKMVKRKVQGGTEVLTLRLRRAGEAGAGGKPDVGGEDGDDGGGD